MAAAYHVYTIITGSRAARSWSARSSQTQALSWKSWTPSLPSPWLTLSLLDCCTCSSSWEHSTQLPNFYPKSKHFYFEPVNVAFLDELVSSSNQFQSIYMTEVIGHLRTENPACSSGVDRPVLDIFWVWPHEIAEWPFVRNLYPAVNRPHLIDGFNFWAESSMNAKNFTWIFLTLPSMTAPMGR